MERLKVIPEAHWLEETRVVAIVRDIPFKSVIELAGALYQGGIRVLEITMNTLDAYQSIEALRKIYRDKMWIGAGTVIDNNNAILADKAGAQFFVTPNVDETVIQFGVSHDIPVFSGAFTPTEVVQAYKAGAAAVKIFPSSSVGAQYIKELQGPLSHIPLLAVGGISADNVAEYIKAGAWGVGVGGKLANKAVIQKGDFATITAYAIRLLGEIQKSLANSPS
jgi:2-dehydro-3-deoxyphosphogluconate aldolase/(4S)-4-hydroxy-2-oxoglutarate aldolase